MMNLSSGGEDFDDAALDAHLATGSVGGWENGMCGIDAKSLEVEWQRGDGVEEEVNGGDGLHHQTANREWGGRFAVPRSTVSTMRHAPLKF